MIKTRCGYISFLLIFGLGVQAAMASSEVSFVRDGIAGFVVSDFKFALGPDAKGSGACPLGMTMTLQETFASIPGGKQRQNESDEEYGDRIKKGTNQLSTAPTGENLCMNPEAGEPDPNFQTVQGADITVAGIDLDGVASDNDFAGVTGEIESNQGVDNQFYRAVGCNRSFQTTGQSNSFAIEMLSGSWGIVIRLGDVDDIQNDDQVTVNISANADPIQLSPTREPLSYASYILDQDARFQSRTTGRIQDGILITDPVDVRFRSVVNSMMLERPLRGAQIKATISEDGMMSGYLAGYSPVEALYDVNFGYRNGKTRHGELAPQRLRSGTANGAAFVLGHTCNGIYYALHQMADGYPDAETGENTAISTQYRFDAIPAFVMDGPEQDSDVRNQTAENHHAD